MIDADRVYDYLKRCDDALRKLGLKKRKLAVAALNPHAREQGLFGREEMDQLTPGIQRATAEGIDAHGPVPADSVFYQAQQGRYDAVLSLYHDQGHIAAKMLDFEPTVSITSGVPFLRTSVDHGTAFDIAGKELPARSAWKNVSRQQPNMHLNLCETRSIVKKPFTGWAGFHMQEFGSSPPPISDRSGYH